MAEALSEAGANVVLTATDRGPIGLPGLIWSLPKWLLDPLGPMAIRPACNAG